MKLILILRLFNLIQQLFFLKIHKLLSNNMYEVGLVTSKKPQII